MREGRLGREVKIWEITDMVVKFCGFFFTFLYLPTLTNEKVKVLVAQTLCDPMECSPLSSSVHGILQARILESVAVQFSRDSFQPWDQTRVSWIAGRFFIVWPPRKPNFNQMAIQIPDRGSKQRHKSFKKLSEDREGSPISSKCMGERGGGVGETNRVIKWKQLKLKRRQKREKIRQNTGGTNRKQIIKW